LFLRNTAPQPLLLLLDICTWQGGAVTLVLLPVAGSAVVLPPGGAPELPLELLLELVCTMQGGTTIFVRLLFLGSSSWFWPGAPWGLPVVWGDPLPPGLSSTVLDFSAFFWPLPCMQGWIATVWSRALLGTTI
jgi:hypothetical protein